MEPHSKDHPEIKHVVLKRGFVLSQWSMYKKIIIVMRDFWSSNPVESPKHFTMHSILQIQNKGKYVAISLATSLTLSLPPSLFHTCACTHTHTHTHMDILQEPDLCFYKRKVSGGKRS